jgi:hypothetical protein
MGLDMYLTAGKRDPDNFDYSDVKDLGYWRKANAIHHWFVQNVQGGEDNCGYYEVPREKIAQLSLLCQHVLKDASLAPKLLPTANGFFFGGTEYDDWYFNGIRKTVDFCELALQQSEPIWYSSSW